MTTSQTRVLRADPTSVVTTIRRRRLRACGWVCWAAIATSACASDPPPKKEPEMCAQVKRDTDELDTERECAGKDTDGDTIDDAVDLCVTTPETNNGIHDGDGCPDPDRDNDLIVDYDDGCPDEAGPLPDGCPQADADGDGLADHLDACPTRAEDLDGERDNDGCPEGDRRLNEGEEVVVALETTVALLRGKTDRTDGGKRALASVLDLVTERQADVVRIEVVGTAGLMEVRRGRAKGLAEERISDVRRLLLASGVPASRVIVTPEVLKGPTAKDTGAVSVRVMIAQAPTASPNTEQSDGVSTGTAKPGAETGTSSTVSTSTSSGSGGAKNGEGKQDTAKTTTAAKDKEPAAKQQQETAANDKRPANQKSATTAKKTPPAKQATTKTKPSAATAKKTAPKKEPPPKKTAPKKEPPPKKTAPKKEPPADDDDWDSEVLGG